VADLSRTLFDPRRLARNAGVASTMFGAARRVRIPKPRTFPLTRPIGRRRAFAWQSLRMDDLVAAKRSSGATVNDVVLAIVAGALRRDLEERGIFSELAPLPRALLPIGMGDRSELMFGNRFSVATVELPVHVDDPLERIRIVHEQMQSGARAAIASLMPLLFTIADTVPLPVLRAAVPPLLAHQPFADLAVSNIPGSRTPLYVWDSRMLRLFPFITGVGNIALIVGVLSYCDELGIGITVDPEVTGDPRHLMARMNAAAEELKARVR
jgi:WS/DGAT/MGAT family acyltransferase